MIFGENRKERSTNDIFSFVEFLVYFRSFFDLLFYLIYIKKMCGIICEIRCSNNSILKDNRLLQRLKNRGPDCVNAAEISVGNGVTVTFCGAVLWMRGPEIIAQPIDNELGVLLYNGDIFDEGWIHDNDTKRIMERLGNLPHPEEEHIIKELKQLKGPFSIIYYNKSTHDLYFTRDRIGRNTLLFHRNETTIAISSVLGRKYKCVEIPASHVHVLNINTNRIKLHPWNDGGGETKVYPVQDWLAMVQKQQSIPDEQFSFDFDDTSVSHHEDDVVGYIKNTSLETTCKLATMSKLMDHVMIKDTVLKITELLKKSIKIRLETQPFKCIKCTHVSGTCKHCVVGILFSGGLDCTILAILADKYLPKQQSIELINVAFKKEDCASYDVPDRLTGRQSYAELKRLCTSREWVFREINVPKKELEIFQRTTIADLVYPRQTILDESLGSALWFAARGLDGNSGSSCRVLLLGSGADELFGGYTRHRNAFKRHGWPGLDRELQLDWRRISWRNLARDNRVISDHGRQPRMPYLDEDFTHCVLNLKPWLKCFPTESLGQGVGDKLMLRLVAYDLGLRDVVTFPKRALQFGSRIANKKEKGSDISKSFIDLGIND